MVNYIIKLAMNLLLHPHTKSWFGGRCSQMLDRCAKLPHLKFYYYLFIFLCIPISLSAQKIKISGQVIDSVSGQGLPFTNIMVVNHQIGTTSGQNGDFELYLPDSLINDSIVFSYVGYKSYKLAISKLNNQPVRLTPHPFELPEVVMNPQIGKNKEFIINKFKERNCFLRYSTSPFDSMGLLHIPYRPTEPTIEAIYFPYNEGFIGGYKLKEVWLYVRNYKSSKSYFRLRIFDVKEDKSPGNDILITPINIEVNEGSSLVKVNMEEYNIFMQNSGMYIGFELLIIPENMSIVKNESGQTAELYSPFLYQIKTKNIGEYWFYTTGKWIMSKYWFFREGIWYEKDKPEIEDKRTAGSYIFKPAISIVLTD